MEAELRIYLYGKEYMIIIYDDHCSFQRCGYRDGSGEQNYNTLDQLYSAKQVDNIVLAKDWNSIEKLECIFYHRQLSASKYVNSLFKKVFPLHKP